MTWRDGEKVYVHVGGTGSISCRGITEEQGGEAEKRSVPLGFRLTREAERIRERVEREARPFHDIVARQIEAGMRASAERLEREIVAELASWGECGWTARDLLIVAW